MGLSCQNEGPVVALDHDRLVPVDVARGRDDVDAGQDFGLTVEQLVPDPWVINEVFDGVVTGLSGGQLLALTHDWLSGQERIASAVIEVKVTVHYLGNVVKLDACASAQCFWHGDSAWPIPRLCLFSSVTQTGVQTDYSLTVADHVAVHGFNPGCAGPGLFRRPHEGAEEHAPNILEPHWPTVRRVPGTPDGVWIADP